MIQNPARTGSEVHVPREKTQLVDIPTTKNDPNI
jgi:hypothetical protein